jgi:hypothetical protein
VGLFWMLRLLTVLVALFAAEAIGADNSFSRTLYPIMQQAGCPACHNANGVASATRLHFPDSEAPPERIEAFGYSLVRLVDRAHPEQSLLLRKPTLRTPHTGGQRIKPGSPQEATLVAWIRKIAALSDAEVAKIESGAPGSGPVSKAPAVTLRRLTHSQYDNTVRDLLGDQTAPARQFPPEDFVNGFKDQYEAQNVSPLLEDAYSAAAEKLAANAFRSGNTRGLIPCKPSPACRDQFIRSFGMRAFRRPLDAAEEKRYTRLFAAESDFNKSAQLVVEAMLQSPNFLFRLDDAANPRWKPYATASRLSYALWDTMPDTELMNTAAHGDLSTRTGVEKTARRMLQDARARQALDEFVAQWLRFDRVLTTSRDRRRYPKFTRETAIAMTEEARQFIADLVWSDRDFMEAFTADYGIMNADLASIYGVPAPAKEFERVQFPADSGRAGLLGQALFLALSAKPDDTSLTGRGLFVREQFLCQHVPPPPATVNTNLPPSTEAHPQTNRERMLDHVNNPTCATCHNLIDPIGFGLEKFDAVGARRDKYKLLFQTGYHGEGKRQPPKSVELPLDTKGWIAGIPDSQFSSPRELGAVLARTPQCQECVVKQYFRYVAGRMEGPADAPVIRRAAEDFRNSHFGLKEAIISLVVAREFPDAEGMLDVARNH